MDENYIKECTKDWRILESDLGLELCDLFDMVYWGYRYAIKFNGEVRDLYDDYSIAYERYYGGLSILSYLKAKGD